MLYRQTFFSRLKGLEFLGLLEKNPRGFLLSSRVPRSGNNDELCLYEGRPKKSEELARQVECIGIESHKKLKTKDVLASGKAFLSDQLRKHICRVSSMNRPQELRPIRNVTYAVVAGQTTSYLPWTLVK